MRSFGKRYSHLLCGLFFSLFSFPVIKAQNITGPSTVTASVNQTDLNQSSTFSLTDNNISVSDKRFLLFGRYDNVPYLRQVNGTRLAFIGANGATNAETFDNGNFKVRNVTLSKFFIEQTGLWDAAYSANISVSGGAVSGGGPHLKTFNSYWEANALNQYITFDMGVTVYLNYITFGSYHATDSRYIPRGYIISYSSDNINYTTMTTVTSSTNLMPYHEFPTTAGRYWRITITEFQPGYSVSKIAGVQLLGGSGSPTTGKYWGNRYGTSAIFFNGEAVGVGVVNVPAGYRFAVNGNAIFAKVRVQTYANWPDYVFDSTHHLPTLDEVEKFIRKNKHLPGMTPALKAETNGIDLADEQAALLKQVEEMMLHLISQEKKIQQLEKEVRELRQEKKRHRNN